MGLNIGKAVSGQYGNAKIGVSQVAETTKWTLTANCNAFRYGSNVDNGSRTTVAGKKEADLALEGKYDPSNPLPSQFDVGASVTFNLYLTAIGFFSVPAVIKSIKYNVDMDTGEIVSWTADAWANGVWQNPASGEMAAPPPEGDKAESPQEIKAGAPANIAAMVEEKVAAAKEQLAAEMRGQMDELKGMLLQFVRPEATKEEPHKAAA